MTGKRAKIAVYKVGNAWLAANYLRMFIIATEGNVYVRSHNKPVVYWGDKRTALLMPIYITEEDIAKGKLIPDAMADGMYILNK